jgi:hypothetical protein
LRNLKNLTFWTFGFNFVGSDEPFQYFGLLLAILGSDLASRPKMAILTFWPFIFGHLAFFLKVVQAY